MSKAGSSLATFLLSVPVSAILLMAVFGVPKFAPGTGGQGNEGGWQDPRQFFAGLTGNRNNEDAELFNDYDARRGDEDPFLNRRGGEGFDAPQWGKTDARGPNSGDEEKTAERSSEPRRLNESDWPFRGRSTNGAGHGDRLEHSSTELARHGDSRLPSRGNDFASDRLPEANGNLTWRNARRRLAELGIQQFHLEPGLTPDTFLFVCMFSPGDDPRVTRRFEAEADDPLAAVEKVLLQIEAWLESRFSEQNGRISQLSGETPSFYVKSTF